MNYIPLSDEINFYVLTIIIGTFLIILGMLIVKKTEKLKYDFSILGLL